MSKLSKLTNKELNGLLLAVGAELEKRKEAEKAEKQIDAILRRFGLVIKDLDLERLSQRTKNKSRIKQNEIKPPKKKRKDKRSAVAPKYFNPDGPEVWSGRGRAPNWVITICNKKQINLKSFKRDQEFFLRAKSSTTNI